MQNLKQQTIANHKSENCSEKNGEDIAFKQLEFRCKPKLMNMLFKIIPEAESQEVFQEALLKIFVIAKQDPTDATFNEKLNRLDPLLFSIAKNLAISKVRHSKVRDAYLHKKEVCNDDQLLESLDITIAKEEEYKLLSYAIEQLPPICKKVFIERKIQGRSHDEISKKFDISKKTVENHITKGLKLCKSFIQTNQHISSDTIRTRKNMSKKSA